jgi:splicing factor 3A subunit 2
MTAVSQRERLRLLAMEKIDLAKDPYMTRTSVGTYECRLCLTQHPNESNYLAHTQGKRHQQNIARRAAKEAREKGLDPASAAPFPAPIALTQTPQQQGPRAARIGRPGYRVSRQHDPETGQRSLLFEIEYPEIEEGLQPRHRFMSAFEQKVDVPPNRRWQYLVFAAEPYETIAFRIPNKPIERDTSDRTKGRFFTEWDKARRVFTLQVHFKPDQPTVEMPPQNEESPE